MSVASNDKRTFFEHVIAAEWEELNRRRKAQGRRLLLVGGPAATANHIVGLALSGGGIRAAALSLGAIHALSSAIDEEHHKVGASLSFFEKIDYISSVSGGSYAACSVAAKIIRDRIKSPLSLTDDPTVLEYLSFVRNNSKLLNNYLSIFINWLYGVVTGLVTILPFLLMLAAIETGVLNNDLRLNALTPSYEWYLGLVALGGLVAYLSFTIALSGPTRVLSFVVAVWRVGAALGVLIIFVELQPVMIRANLPGGTINDIFLNTRLLRPIKELGIQEIAIPLAFFIVLGSILVAFFMRRERFLRKDSAANRLILYRVGIQICLAALLIVGPVSLWSVILMFSRWGITCGGCGVGNHDSPEIVFTAAKRLNDWLMPLYEGLPIEKKYYQDVGTGLPALNYSVLYIIVAVGLFILTKYMIDANKSSFHRYYRESIKNCFFQPQKEIPQISHLSNLTSPYFLVNCTLNAKVNRGRKIQADEPFVIGNCYTGNRFVGYGRTKLFENAIGPDFDLATIAAISGAAFSPVMGRYTISSFRLLMSVLALRLGYWIPNPWQLTTTSGGPFGLLSKWFFGRWAVPGRRVDGVYLLREMFGLLSARSPFLDITDGGHTDNSGIFELLRRRCGTIIAIDSESDPEQLFANMVYVMELARSRLNVEITLTCRTVGSEGGTHCAIGEISYPPIAGLPEASGRLVYCKLSLTGDENWDLLCRRRASGEFPYHSTMNQNYDELLFNAYRVLGTHIVGRVILGLDRVEFSNGDVRILSPDELRSLFP
jgi:hypothetical protein